MAHQKSLHPIETRQIEYNGWTLSAFRYPTGITGWVGIAVRPCNGRLTVPGDGIFETAEAAFERGRILVDNCAEYKAEQERFLASRRRAR